MNLLLLVILLVLIAMDIGLPSVLLLECFLLAHYFALIATDEPKNSRDAPSSSRGNLPPENDEIAISIGRIENDEVVPSDLTNYREFESDKTYIMVVQTGLEEENSFWDIFYWIGKESSDLDAAGAALNAILVHSTNSSTIYRVGEGEETCVFRAIFEFIGREIGNNGQNKRSSSQKTTDAKSTKMVLIEGREIAHLQQVELSLSQTERDDICLVIFNRDIVYTYCGITVEENVQTMMAKTLARIVLRKMGPGANEMTILRNRESELSQEQKEILEKFFKDIKRMSKAIGKQKSFREPFNKPIKVRKKIFSFFKLMRCSDVAVKEQVETVKNTEDPEKVEEKVNLIITRIYGDDRGNLSEEKLPEVPSSLFPFKTDDCYIIDPCSKIGLCVWMGNNSDLDVRVECACRAELILRRRNDCPPRPIAFFDEEDIDLPTEPRLRVHLDNFIRLMEDLNLSWNDLLKKDSRSATSELSEKCREPQERPDTNTGEPGGSSHRV